MRTGALAAMILALACSRSETSAPPKAENKPAMVPTSPAKPAESSSVPVFIVLKEDTYETKMGDGYFAYFDAAFRDRAEADAYIARKKGEPVPKDTMPADYHLRPGTLKRAADGGWALDCELRQGEKAEVEKVVAALKL